MYVFIDEAGDVGFKSHSSKYFILVLIIFRSEEKLNNADAIIQRQKIKDRIKIEYKSSKTDKALKRNFFNCVKQLDFEISFLLVNKNALYDKELKTHSKQFYRYFLKRIIDESPITKANVKIDKSSGNVFQEQLKTYLMKNVVKDKINKFKFEDSKANNLIQLADMVAGVLVKHYQNKEGNNEDYRDAFKDKIIKEIIVR